jgi:hypothetical protein
MFRTSDCSRWIATLALGSAQGNPTALGGGYSYPPRASKTRVHLFRTWALKELVEECSRANGH